MKVVVLSQCSSVMNSLIHWYIVATILTFINLSFSIVGVSCQDYKKVGLDAHNLKRKLHQGVGLLELDNDIQTAAVKCAEYYGKRKLVDYTCPHIKTDKFPPYHKLGENIFMTTWSTQKPPDAVRMAVSLWYEEILDWDFEKSKPKKGKEAWKCHHFTQIVWKKTKKLGVGHYSHPNFGTVVVALYGPMGNDISETKENVPPLRKH